MRFVLAVALLILVASAAVAQGTQSYYFDYQCNGGYKVVARSQAGSVLGHDAGDTDLYPPSFNPTDIGLTIYKQNGKYGWDSATGLLVMDSRSPLAPGQTEVFEDIFLWAGSAVAPKNLQLSFYKSGVGSRISHKLILAALPDGVSYVGPREWNLNSGTITLPFFSTDDLTKGYRFRAEITALPEPSSALAVAGGIVGMAGVLLRRRRS